jgi:hypothetical protein
MWLIPPGGRQHDPVIIYTGEIDGLFGRATHELVPLRAARPPERRRIDQRVAQWQGLGQTSSVSLGGFNISRRSSDMTTVR